MNSMESGEIGIGAESAQRPQGLRRIQRLRLYLKPLFVGPQQLRGDRLLIPGFIEESLRVDSPVKSDSRLARMGSAQWVVSTYPRAPVVLAAAVNRDPCRFREPARVARAPTECGSSTWPLVAGSTLGRGGRVPGRRAGSPSCASWPGLSDIAIGDVHHGPAAERRCSYGPTYILRGPRDLRRQL
jgi:hypothetical protein